MNNHTIQTQKTQIQAEFSTFKFDKSEIRTLVINREPWFVARDLCDALGLSNSRMSLLALDDDEKGVSLIYTHGGQQEMSIVSESGMYTLILRCRDAVKKGSIPHSFRKWVTAEVLPTIRKTGKYENKTTVDERTGLRDAVNMLVSKKGLIYSEAYHLVHQRFNVQSIEELTSEQLPMAVEYVHKLCLEGELIIDEPKQLNNCTIKEEEALHIIVNLFHSLNGAYDMGEKIRNNAPHIGREIDKELGGYHIYNLNEPTHQALAKARKYIQAKSERIMFVKGMLSLLEEPKRIAN